MNWYITAVKRFADFSGRAQRAEYWYFVLFYVLILIGLSLIDGVTGTYSEDAGAGLLSGLFMLVMLIPAIAVSVRRLHDTDRSGWWLLISLVPLLGVIVMLVFTVQAGTAGTNRFGPDPKAGSGPIGSGMH